MHRYGTIPYRTSPVWAFLDGSAFRLFSTVESYRFLSGTVWYALNWMVRDSLESLGLACFGQYPLLQGSFVLFLHQFSSIHTPNGQLRAVRKTFIILICFGQVNMVCFSCMYFVLGIHHKFSKRWMRIALIVQLALRNI